VDRIRYAKCKLGLTCSPAPSRTLGSAQIDVKISFKGRQPNKESAAKPLCRYVSPATALHTKRNVIPDAWRSLKRLNFALRMRKKEIKSAFLRSRKQALAAD
jgi:hypothetical protein